MRMRGCIRVNVKPCATATASSTSRVVFVVRHHHQQIPHLAKVLAIGISQGLLLLGLLFFWPARRCRFVWFVGP